MDSAEYSRLKDQSNVLDYETLRITLIELTKLNELELGYEIGRILKENKIIKPILHLQPNNLTTTFYKIDLLSEQLEKLRDIFLDLEVSHVNPNGDTTTLATLYASICDRWNDLANG